MISKRYIEAERELTAKRASWEQAMEAHTTGNRETCEALTVAWQDYWSAYERYAATTRRYALLFMVPPLCVAASAFVIVVVGILS